MRSRLAVVRSFFAVLIGAGLLGACTYVPVKEVKKCAKIIDVQLMESYVLGIIPTHEITAYSVLDNGKFIEHEGFSGFRWRGSDSDSWLNNAKIDKIGNEYCWIEYERA